MRSAFFGQGNFAAAAEAAPATVAALVRRFIQSMVFTALVAIGSSSSWAVAVTDDFSDMNDTANPTWTHLDGLVGSTGQTWDASTGIYRMQAPSNADVGGQTIGFVGSHVGPEFTDVRVTMDLLEFYTMVAFPNGPAFINILARSNGDNTFGAITGYGYGFDPVADANAGEMVLYRIDAGIDVNDIGSQRITLDETKDYRLMLEVIGNTIHGQVTEIGTGTIVADSFADISSNEPIYTSGTSGAYGYTFNPFSTVFGIDNFRAEEALAGDYNRDGSVDAADYVVWRDTAGNTSPQLDPSTFRVTSFGDMRANGAVSGMCGFNRPDCEVIDEADYEVWRAHFGRTVSVSTAGNGTAVPEPTTAALVLIGLAWCAVSIGRVRS